MGTTFDTTTEAERATERAILKAAVLAEHVPELSGSVRLGIATGRIRLSFAAPRCKVSFAIRVAAQIHHEGRPTMKCPCAECSEARSRKGTTT